MSALVFDEEVIDWQRVLHNCTKRFADLKRVFWLASKGGRREHLEAWSPEQHLFEVSVADEGVARTYAQEAAPIVVLALPVKIALTLTFWRG